MSTPASTDLILVERSNTLYKETKANYDTATGGGGGGGGGSSTNGIVIKMYWGQISAGYHASGQHKYKNSGGSLFYSRTDSSGSYTRTSSASSSYANNRPNTKVNVDGTWYSIGTHGTTVSANNAGGPCNAYYRRTVCSWSYTSAEMDAATGATSGQIRGIQVECYATPSGSYNYFPSFGVSLITHNVSSTTTNYSSQTFSYTNHTGGTKIWSTGFNSFPFSSSYYVSWS